VALIHFTRSVVPARCNSRSSFSSKPARPCRQLQSMDEDYQSLWVCCENAICKECRMSEYRRKLPFLMAAGLCFACRPDTASAREPEPLPVEIALRSHSFSEISPLAVSPDGKWIAYSVHDNLRMLAKRDQGIEKERYVRSGIFLQRGQRYLHRAWETEIAQPDRGFGLQLGSSLVARRTLLSVPVGSGRKWTGPVVDLGLAAGPSETGVTRQCEESIPIIRNPVAAGLAGGGARNHPGARFH
jgi:hypothetical protein